MTKLVRRNVILPLSGHTSDWQTAQSKQSVCNQIELVLYQNKMDVKENFWNFLSGYSLPNYVQLKLAVSRCYVKRICMLLFRILTTWRSPNLLCRSPRARWFAKSIAASS
jgi:hypothetical protein